MKKILFLMIVVAVAFSSCSKDDNDDDTVVAPHSNKYRLFCRCPATTQHIIMSVTAIWNGP
jgi:hypothetical protein